MTDGEPRVFIITAEHGGPLGAVQIEGNPVRDGESFTVVERRDVTIKAPPITSLGAEPDA